MHFFRPDFTRSVSPCWRGLFFTAAALLAGAAHQASGATVSARSPALADVSTAIALAKDGDTVTVPAGTAHWTNQLPISKGVILRGATTVTGAGTKTPTVSDLTVIINDATGAPNLVDVKLTAAQNFQLTGVTCRAGLSTGTLIHLVGSGGNTPVMSCRVDHCHLVGSTNRSVQTDGWLYGVADHNFIETKANGQCFFLNAATYGGKLLGHGSWADYPWFGTEKFFFIEDNTMTGEGLNPTNGAIDAELAARFVVRYNYFINCRPGWHGTEGNSRGTRSVEVYDNTFDWTIIFSASARSGTALYHDNKWVNRGSTNNSHSAIHIYREMGGVSATSTYAFANGSNSWDSNDTDASGKPKLYDNGIVTAGDSSTLTDSSKNWATNQWVGYSVTQANPSAASYSKCGFITGNTAHQITYYAYTTTDRGPILNFVANDTYQIRKVQVALDQVGRGKGDLMSGSGTTAQIASTKTPGWPHQALEPAMSWNNVHIPSGAAYGFATGFPTEVQGRDYYNLGKGFPVSSTPSQVSSIYTSALNGTNYTGPYTYPHPLVTLSPPTNLTVVP